MSAKKKGLGLGANTGLGKRLQALGLAEKKVEAGTPVVDHGPIEIDVDRIVTNPHQPRQTFDPAALEELASSIKQYGLIQPIVVRRLTHGQYELIAGERRLRATKLAKSKTITALIKEYTPQEATEIALIENLQRENLNAMEEGAAYARLIEEFHLTQDEAAKKVGKSRSHVANMMRLLHLAPPVQEYLFEGKLSMGQARPLLQLPETTQLKAAEKIIAQCLSARQAEQLVKSLTAPQPKTAKAEPSADLEALQDRMKLYLGTPVSIHLGKQKGKGKIEISFTSPAELERLLAMLTDDDDQSDAPVSTFHV